MKLKKVAVISGIVLGVAGAATPFVLRCMEEKEPDGIFLEQRLAPGMAGSGGSVTVTKTITVTTNTNEGE